MPERTTVRLSEELLTRAKRKAARDGRTLTSLIEEGLRAVIAETRGAPAPGRVFPRVSKARGGLLPGLDLRDLGGVQELDDLDRVQRMQRSE
jgi:hypothetical protein